MTENKGDRPNRKSGRGTPGNGGMRFSRGLFGWFLFIALCVSVYLLLRMSSTSSSTISLSAAEDQMRKGNVSKIWLEGDQIRGLLIAPQAFPPQYQRPVSEFRAETPTGWLQGPGTGRILDLNNENKTRAEVVADYGQNVVLSLLLPFIPWLLVFGFIYFFLYRQLRNSANAGGMLGNFGRSRHRITSKEHTNITFDDVAGIQEAKDEVMEIVEFLKNPKKFQRLGGRIPRGVLLVGEPGTGKTLLAKAIAGEADVPFFSISGSDFVEMFVGVGASRVRDLFKQAKDNAPCIIFLDEIDAVGRRRGSGFSSGGHDEREQTLNAILVEMDGFDTNDQIIVCAATNRVDVLDPALTRPGRFDRQIYVPLPDVKGRFEILKVHSRKVKLGSDVDLLRLAKATPGFSGADLAAVINESALHATLANKDFIEQDDLEESRDKVRWGRARKSRVVDEKEKQQTAYHEAGHAVVQALDSDSDPIHKVTILPRGNMGGATMSLPDKDRMAYSKRWCVAYIKMCFGGRIAEEMFFNDVNSGAYGDIRQATGLARKMIRDWGMSDNLGFVFYGDYESRSAFDLGLGSREYSEDTNRLIDGEVKSLIARLYAETKSLLEANRDKIEAIARALLKYETIDGQDVDRLMRGETLTRPTVGDLLEREQNKRPAAPQPAAPDTGVQPGLGGPVPAPG
ncbi:MAG: ATP-dependent zinc metalloprotease FtsH [Tepidisphaerales bacterium]